MNSRVSGQCSHAIPISAKGCQEHMQDLFVDNKHIYTKDHCDLDL